MLTGHREHLLSRTETVGLRHSNGQPNYTKQEVDGVNRDGQAEHRRVPPRREVVDGNGNDQNALGNGPDESTPFDIVVSDPAGEVDLPYG